MERIVQWGGEGDDQRLKGEVEMEGEVIEYSSYA